MVQILEKSERLRGLLQIYRAGKV